MRKMAQDSEKVASKISKSELDELTTRVQKIEDSDKAPSVVELKALVASGQLAGKGLEIKTVDIDGKELSSVAFEGSDSSEGVIQLRVVREDVQVEG